ncbi:MAG TPA: hypothetical protein VJI66_00025 [Candidatus Paceibacterota bacterium]
MNKIKSEKYKGGYVILLNTLFFIAISLIITLGVAQPLSSHINAGRAFESSNKSFLEAHSVMEEAYYRLIKSMNIGSSQTITFASSSALVTVENTATGKKVTVTSDEKGFERKIQLDLALGTGISFHYGMQSGQGGFLLENSSSITGNVFSNGPIIGSGGNFIRGDAVSTGPFGFITGIHATGTVYAHNISNVDIDKDAYYVTITNSTVVGTQYPNSPDLEDVDMPISDAQISEWESDAAAGGSVTCSGGKYVIGDSVNIGPKKIPCDLQIKGSDIVVTLDGPVWVTGDISIENGTSIRLSSSLGVQSLAMIADDPGDTAGSGIISVTQGAGFAGSGTAGSFIFLISQNNSAETGGTVEAIDLGQHSNSLIVYARHGLIHLGQTVNVKEATAYKIRLTQSATATYDSGLPSTLFSSGPSGGYSIVSWSEI